MARNQEKAQTMLARWLRYKEEQVKGPKKRRPYLAELCDDLHEAEKWRGTIIKDISRNVAEIQNASLGEHRIRDLNDRINKLFREKRHWERRIKNLGGKNYKHTSKGYGGYGHGAYLYFGAAKDLPGVKELLKETEAISVSNKQKYVNKDRVTNQEKKSRMEMYQMIDADYYGFGDDDDGELVFKEKDMQQKLRRVKIEKWKKENKDKVKDLEDRKRMIYNEGKRKKMRVTKISGYVPSEKEIDEAILRKRKELLLRKYVGDNENGETEEAKSLAKSVQIQKKQQMLNEKENDDDDDDVDMTQD